MKRDIFDYMLPILFLIAAAIFSACSGDNSPDTGSGFLNFLVWVGSHKALILCIIGLLTPFIALLPVVGAPLAMVFTVFVTKVMPGLVALADAVEEDEERREVSGNGGRLHLPDRSIDEAAVELVKRAESDVDLPVGQKAGAKLFARIAARRVMKKARKRRTGNG